MENYAVVFQVMLALQYQLLKEQTTVDVKTRTEEKLVLVVGLQTTVVLLLAVADKLTRREHKLPALNKSFYV